MLSIACLCVTLVLSSVMMYQLIFHLSWSPPSFIIVPGAPTGLLSALVPYLIICLVVILVYRLALMSILFYQLPRHPFCSIICPVVCSITWPGIPSILFAICPNGRMFFLLPAIYSCCFLHHLSLCFICSQYHLSLSPLFYHFLIEVCCTWTAGWNKQNIHTSKHKQNKTKMETKTPKKTNKKNPKKTNNPITVLT